jgi:hypothetical protein
LLELKESNQIGLSSSSYCSTSEGSSSVGGFLWSSKS